MSGIQEPGGLGQLDLNLFRVFDVVHRERSLTRAAERLFLSQSAVSHALGRLRAQLGDPLFVRQGRGVTPTPLAERLAPDVRRALQLLQLGAHGARPFEPRRDLGHVSVAMNDELEPSLLPPWVARLRAAVPEVQVTSVRLERERLKLELASGRLDLAVDVAQPTGPELHHAPLWSDAFCVVSARRRPLSAEAYLAARHVTVSSRRAGLAVEDLALSRLGYRREVAVRCQHYEAACRVVARSDLLLTMPRRHAEAVNARLGNHLLPLPLSVPPVELHLYWHRQADPEPRNRWLRAELLASASLSAPPARRAPRARRGTRPAPR